MVFVWMADLEWEQADGRTVASWSTAGCARARVYLLRLVIYPEGIDGQAYEYCYTRCCEYIRQAPAKGLIPIRRSV